MIPRTFPSTFAANGQPQMVVYSLPSITGLTAWIDYIPVKGVTTESATLENTYANGGYQVVDSLASLTGKQAWLDYIPVYEDTSYAKPWSTDAGGYIPTSALAALLLDFTSGRLDPRITFNRTTNATLTNSAGLIANAPMNLLTFSEQFDNAAWTNQVVGAGTTPVRTANAAAAPNGTLTADRLQFSLGGGTTTGDQSYISQAVTITQNSAISVWFKSNTSSSYNLYLRCSNTGTTITVTPEWQRFSLVGVLSGGAVHGFGLRGGQALATSNTADILAWGAQLELGSTATAYNPTTVKNLLGFTEHFDNAAWTKSNATISATKVDDIYGQPFAQKLVENTASNTHTVFGAFTPTASTQYTGTVYVKAAERQFAFVLLFGAFTSSAISVNLTTGAVSTALGSPVNAFSENMGNGWYRVGFTLSATGSTGSTLTLFASTDGVWGNRVYTGDGTSGIFIFGAQLSDAASVDPYVYQPVAAPTSTAYFGPRFDYDPVTLAPKGLLIEEQRTQLLLNSSLAGTSLVTQNVTVTAVAHTLSFYGTGTVTLSGVSTAGPLAGTGGYPNRATLTFTPTAGTLTLTVTGTVQFAQLEAGAFATSFIPSAASQVTRAADNASMIGNNFARWYTQGAGSLYFQATPLALDGSTKYFGSVNDGTTTNFTGIFKTGSALGAVTLTGAVSQGSMFAGTATTTTASKMAVGYETNNSVFVVGAATASDASVTLPAQLTQLSIGSLLGANSIVNCTISRIANYNRRLANTELQAITS